MGQQTNNERLSVWFHDSSRRAWHVERARRMYPWMLIEDIHNQIMPYLLTRDRSRFRVEVDPDDPYLKSLIARAIAQRNASIWELDEIVADFFRETVRGVLTNTVVAYEVTFASSDPCKSATTTKTEANPGKDFALVQIPPGSFSVTNQHVVQRVPPDVANYHRVPQVIQIPLTRAVVFGLPAEDRDRVNQVLDHLAEISEYPSLPSPMYTKRGEFSGKFDFKSYRRTHALAIAEATREIGWNARALFDKYVTEYYQVWRQLKYEELLIRMRKEFLQTLNDGLGKAGEQIGATPKLTLHGLPSNSDVATARDALREGDKFFSEIIEGLSI